MKQALKTIWMSARPPFLLLTVSVILLGAALAAWEGVPFDWQRFVLVMIGGLAAHASVNLLNEYEDWRSGLDAMTERTPFSGGSGALQAHPEHAEYVMGAGYFLLGVVIAIGLYFIHELGWGLLPIGLLGIALIVFYTTRLTRMPWLCLIAPGLASGSTDSQAAVLCGAAAVLGHCFPLYLRFSGGKGVATACGAIAAVDPLVVLAAGLVWAATLKLTRYVGLSSIMMGLAFPVAAWWRQPSDTPLLVGCALLAVLVVARHRQNIGRMLQGTEPRAGHKEREKKTADPNHG